MYKLSTAQALTFRTCLLRVGRACDYGRVPPAEKRHQREAPASEGHFIPRDITGQLPVEQVSSASVESVHLRSWGQFLPRTRSLRPPRRGREKQVPLGLRPTGRTGRLFCPGHPPTPGPACMRRGQGQGQGQRHPRVHDESAVPHTDSSVDSSSGLMYSNPSNSDWSILLITSLWRQTEKAQWACLRSALSRPRS